MSSALVFGQAAEFSFSKKNLKLPKTPEGEAVYFEYPFTNKGDLPLVINEIKVACPCTQSKYPMQPIKPNEEGSINVSFDTKGKIGYQDRILEVHSNAEGSPHKLRFRVMVDNK